MTFSSNHAIQLSSNIMKWFSLIVSVLLLSSCAGRRADLADIKVGDIVFIESQSEQSPYIKIGTMSKWTHCGVVVDTPEGLKVLEASKTVRLTPYSKFIGAAKDDNWCVKRPRKTIKGPIELCDPRKVSSFVMARVPKVKKLMQKRNIRMDQEVVAPVDIYKAV